MLKFKEKFWDVLSHEMDLYDDGYEYHLVSDKGRAPLLVGSLCSRDPRSLEEFTERVSVLPPGVVTSEKRTLETDAEAIEWFKNASEAVWGTLATEHFGLFITNPALVILCYKETVPYADVFFESRYPLATMYLGDEGLVVETDIFEEA